MQVVLGPAIELHTGMHGALLESPPPGVVYEQRPHRYRYWFRRSLFPPNPFDRLAVDEAVDYDGPPPALVHACRTPVDGDGPWVVDHDDFVAALKYGQLFALGSEAAIRRGACDPRSLARRQRAILARHLEPRCRAVMFWTDAARGSAAQYLAAAGIASTAELDALMEKSAVVRPAVPVIPRTPAAGPVHVVCSGRTFEDKGGELALDVFREIVERVGESVRLTLVGAVPPALAVHSAATIVPVLPRADYLALLGRTDVFFSPTEFESFGMALLEAAAAGAAIVTSCGDGMEHMPELFEDGRHACLVPNEWPYDRKVASYASAIERLVRDAGLRLALGARARSLVEHGPFSIAARDRAVLACYARAAARDRTNARSSARAAGLEAHEYSEQYCWMEIAARRAGQSTRIRL